MNASISLLRSCATHLLQAHRLTRFARCSLRPLAHACPSLKQGPSRTTLSRARTERARRRHPYRLVCGPGPRVHGQMRHRPCQGVSERDPRRQRSEASRGRNNPRMSSVIRTSGMRMKVSGISKSGVSMWHVATSHGRPAQPSHGSCCGAGK